MTRGRTIVGVIAAVVVGWLLWRAYDGWYRAPRAELVALRAERQADLDKRLKALDDAPRVEGEIRAWADRSLGGDLETVDHVLRSRLNRLAEIVGVEEASVGTGDASALTTPARSRVPRSLRDRVDLVALDGWISATGTWPQVVELIDRVDAEPWTKRIEQVRLTQRPADRFGVTLRLSTMFLPGREPSAVPEIAYDRSRLDRLADLLAPVRFDLPAPPSDPEPEPEATAGAAEPAFPWHEWTLSGVAESPAGPEAWLRNTRTGKTRVLIVGDGWRKLVLREVGVDWAEFERDEARLRVPVGGDFGEVTASAEP